MAKPPPRQPVVVHRRSRTLSLPGHVAPNSAAPTAVAHQTAPQQAPLTNRQHPVSSAQSEPIALPQSSPPPSPPISLPTDASTPAIRVFAALCAAGGSMARSDLLTAADIDDASAGPLIAGLVQNRYLRSTTRTDGPGYELTDEGEAFAEARGLVMVAPAMPTTTPSIPATKSPRAGKRPHAALIGVIGRVEPGASDVSEGTIPADGTVAAPTDANSMVGGQQPGAIPTKAVAAAGTAGTAATPTGVVVAKAETEPTPAIPSSPESQSVEDLIYDLDHILATLVARGEVAGDQLGLIDAGGYNDNIIARAVTAAAGRAELAGVIPYQLPRIVALALLDPAAGVRSAAAGVCRPFLGDMEALGAAAEVAAGDPERGVVMDLLIAVAGDGDGDGDGSSDDLATWQVVIAIAATRHPIPIIRLLALTIIAGWPEPWRYVAHMTHDEDGDIAVAAWRLFDRPGASATVIDTYLADIDRKLAASQMLPSYDLANAERLEGNRQARPAISSSSTISPGPKQSKKITRKPPRRRPSVAECQRVANQHTPDGWVTSDWSTYLLIEDEPAKAIGNIGKRPPTSHERCNLRITKLQDQIKVGKPSDAMSLFWYLATMVIIPPPYPDRYQTAKKALGWLQSAGIELSQYNKQDIADWVAREVLSSSYEWPKVGRGIGKTKGQPQEWQARRWLEKMGCSISQ